MAVLNNITVIDNLGEPEHSSVRLGLDFPPPQSLSHTEPQNESGLSTICRNDADTSSAHDDRERKECEKANMKYHDECKRKECKTDDMLNHGEHERKKCEKDDMRNHGERKRKECKNDDMIIHGEHERKKCASASQSTSMLKHAYKVHESVRDKVVTKPPNEKVVVSLKLPLNVQRENEQVKRSKRLLRFASTDKVVAPVSVNLPAVVPRDSDETKKINRLVRFSLRDHSGTSKIPIDSDCRTREPAYG